MDRVDSPPPPLFRESQLVARWLMLPILVGLAAFFWYLGATLPRPIDLVMRAVASFVTLLSLFLIASFSRMATELTPAELRVRFGWLPLFGEVVPLRQLNRGSVDITLNSRLASFEIHGAC
jgi:membrane protein YdbS with pleckstrin-like domain